MHDNTKFGTFGPVADCLQNKKLKEQEVSDERIYFMIYIKFYRYNNIYYNVI
jgi:hypothetical protein